jgi:hypothetical protein
MHGQGALNLHAWNLIVATFQVDLLAIIDYGFVFFNDKSASFLPSLISQNKVKREYVRQMEECADYQYGWSNKTTPKMRHA